MNFKELKNMDCQLNNSVINRPGYHIRKSKITSNTVINTNVKILHNVTFSSDDKTVLLAARKYPIVINNFINYLEKINLTNEV